MYHFFKHAHRTIYAKFDFFLVEFQALNTLHFYDMNIFCPGDLFSFLKGQLLLIRQIHKPSCICYLNNEGKSMCDNYSQM